MKVVVVVLLLLQVFLLMHPALAQISFTDHGYENVIVTISPDIRPEKKTEIIDGIKTWISQGSQLLFTATRQLAYISEVKILIPQTWDITEAEESSLAVEDGDIRVMCENPLYGDVPYTLRARGCGERGEHIHVTPDYVINVNQSADIIGRPGNVFVHEWAKFRYGVFEEHGYPGDEMYPLFYKEDIRTANGFKTVLKPNFGTDKGLEGHAEDIDTGEECSENEPTCLFNPDGDNSHIKCSVMAAPFLDSVERFCHDDYAYLPTKQNDKCSGQSTWDVISRNGDFNDISPVSFDQIPETKFTILKSGLAQFVMVLDRSSSMKEEIPLLRQIARAWIIRDVEIGSFVGVTSFSDDATEDLGMTEITDLASREKMVDAIDKLTAEGETCLHRGVEQGLETLASTGQAGGVMIFITDGNQACNEFEFISSELKEKIRKSRVKIVTIAFGKDADLNLETLTVLTGGKKYFVADGRGVEHLIDAMTGSLTYQPAVPTEEVDIVIKRVSVVDYSTSEKIDEFIVDQTIGRDVQIRVQYQKRDSLSTLLRAFLFLLPDGQPKEPALSPNDEDLAYVATFGDLEPGTYGFALDTGGTLDFADIVISSKAAKDSLPIETTCWVNVDDLDLEKSALSFFAQVRRGNYPVMNALVTAKITTREGKDLRVRLFDDGRDADLVANDGIYSKSYADFTDNGRYSLKCEVFGDEYTEVNNGFIISKKVTAPSVGPDTSRQCPMSRSFWLHPEDLHRGPPICCGSDAISEISVPSTKTGDFEREAVGGTFKVRNVNTTENLYSLGRITDLVIYRGLETFTITFTSPKDDFTVTPFAYYIGMSEDVFVLLSDLSNQTRVTKAILAPESNDLEPVDPGSRKIIIIDILAGIREKVFTMESIIWLAVANEDVSGELGPTSKAVSVAIRDLIPPGRVDDLTLENDVTLTFTEVGDDGLVGGPAAILEVCFSRDRKDLSSPEAFVNKCSHLSNSDFIIPESGESPLTPGEPGSNHVLTLSSSAQLIQDQDNYVALVTVDNEGNRGAVSNVVKVPWGTQKKQSDAVCLTVGAFVLVIIGVVVLVLVFCILVVVLSRRWLSRKEFSSDRGKGNNKDSSVSPPAHRRHPPNHPQPQSQSQPQPQCHSQPEPLSQPQPQSQPRPQSQPQPQPQHDGWTSA